MLKKTWKSNLNTAHLGICEMSYFIPVQPMLPIFYVDVRYLMYWLRFNCVNFRIHLLILFIYLFFFCNFDTVSLKISSSLVGQWCDIALKTCQDAVKLVNQVLYFLREKKIQYYRGNDQVLNYVHCLSNLQWLIICLSSKHSFMALPTALQ